MPRMRRATPSLPRVSCFGSSTAPSGHTAVSHFLQPRLLRRTDSNAPEAPTSALHLAFCRGFGGTMVRDHGRPASESSLQTSRTNARRGHPARRPSDRSGRRSSMSRSSSMSLYQIRMEGWRALTERLGAAGAMRFMMQYDPGYGDYTNERHEIFADLTI